MQKKTKIIIFIVIFLLLLSVIAVFVFYKKDLKQTGVPQAEIQQAGEEQLDDYHLGKKARKENNIKYCHKLESNDPDECIYVVASYNNDKELCGKIQNEDIKKECYESFAYQEIISGVDVSNCQSLTINKFNKQCLSNFFWQWDDIGKCANFEGAGKSDCEDIINKKAAYKKNDIKLCDSIKNSALSADCKKIIANKPKDSDNDGLLDSEERSYGTNPFEADSDSDGLHDLEEISEYFADPNNPDTDGDGYLDGEEVKAGYNPNGEEEL
ncbi:hypothetical protein KAU09_05390 [Candidatus Parcubacteria bacterium]|nr:hypothetical protein [Candidatus Parcubacteria bacterium]